MFNPILLTSIGLGLVVLVVVLAVTNKKDYKYQKDVYIAYNNNTTDKQNISYSRKQNVGKNIQTECKKECDQRAKMCDAFQVIDNPAENNATCTVFKIQDTARLRNVPDNLKDFYTIGVKKGINISRESK